MLIWETILIRPKRLGWPCPQTDTHTCNGLMLFSTISTTWFLRISFRHFLIVSEAFTNIKRKYLFFYVVHLKKIVVTIFDRNAVSKNWRNVSYFWIFEWCASKRIYHACFASWSPSGKIILSLLPCSYFEYRKLLNLSGNNSKDWHTSARYTQV